jgi:histone acetyltransferase 1
LGRDKVAELTVEDPAEAFEDLRDRNDLKFLVSQGITEDPLFLEGIGQNERGPRASWEKETRKKYKIAQVRNCWSVD